MPDTTHQKTNSYQCGHLSVEVVMEIYLTLPTWRFRFRNQSLLTLSPGSLISVDESIEGSVLGFLCRAVNDEWGGK